MVIFSELSRTARLVAPLLLVCLPLCSRADEKADAGRPRQVGYRRTQLQFTVPSGEERTRQLDLWYPTSEREQRHDYKPQAGFAAESAAVAPGKHPLLIFSHGYLGSSDQVIFLTESCARAGYIVAAMNHADSLSTRRTQRAEPPRFLDAASWTDEKFRDRKEDVVALLDQMLAWNKEEGSPWKGRIDPDRIGAMGHSLGGYTMLGMAGGWKTWTEPRFKAAVLFSPYAQPYSANGDAGNVTIPVMMQGGTLDFGITPFLPRIYDKLNGPKALMVLKNESHFGWTNLASLSRTTTETAAAGNPELIVEFTVAFFDEYLLGVDRSDLLEKGDPKLESYRSQKNSQKKQKK